jgi:ACDE family multidrug resistance protein
MKDSSKFALWIILSSATLTVMAGAIISPVLNLMREDLGIDRASAGLIITTHALFVALFSPLVGSLMDKIGPKKPYLFGLVLYGLAGGAGLFVRSYWPLLALRALLGIAVAAIMNPITVMILNLYQGAVRNKVMGWRGSANSVGGIVWPLVGGLLGGLSWRIPFGVYAVGIPLGVLALIAVPEARPEDRPHAGQGGPVWVVLREHPLLFVIYGLMLLTNVLLYTIVVFVPQLLERIGVSRPFHISLYLTAMTLSAGVTSFLYGRIKSRASYERIILISLSLWAIGYTAVSQAASPPIIALAAAFFGIGQGMTMPALMVWVGELVPAPFRGRAAAYLGMFGSFGQFLAPALFGALLRFVALDGIFLIAGGICALIFLVLIGGKRIWNRSNSATVRT